MAKVEIIEGVGDERVAGWIFQRLTAALSRSAEPIAINVPGGSTPFPIIEALTGAPIDWRRILVCPGDDRLVAEDDLASNIGRVRPLLEPLGARIMPLSDMEQVPHFALSWLGMGTDGHVASLFPNTDPQADDDQPIRRITPDPLPPEAPFDRITLTIPALLASEDVLFVIRGNEKRRLFEAAMRGENDTPVARLLEAADQPVTCFV